MVAYIVTNGALLENCSPRNVIIVGPLYSQATLKCLKAFDSARVSTLMSFRPSALLY